MISTHRLYSDLFSKDGSQTEIYDLRPPYVNRHRSDLYYLTLKQIYKCTFLGDGYKFQYEQTQRIKELYTLLIKKHGIDHVIESISPSAAGKRAISTGSSIPQFVQKGDISGLVVSKEDMTSLCKGECYSIHGIWGDEKGPFKEGDIKWEFMESSKSIVKFKEFSYFLRQGGSDFCKVGKSTNCIKRYQSISTSNPCVEFRFIASTPENLIHNRLHHRNLNWRNEWFKVSYQEEEKLKNFCLRYEKNGIFKA